MKINKYINDNLYFLFIFLFYFLLVDFAVTRGLRTSDIVQFFKSDKKYGYIFKPNHKIKLAGPFDEFFHYSFSNNHSLRKTTFRESCPKKYSYKNNRGRYLKYTGIIVGDKKLSAIHIPDEQNFISLINKNCDSSLIFLNGGVDTYSVEMSLMNIERIRNTNLEIGDLNILVLSVNDFFGNKYMRQKEVYNFLNRDERKNNFLDQSFNQIYTSFALSRNIISKIKSNFINSKNINLLNYSYKKYPLNKVCKNIIQKVDNFLTYSDRVNKIYLMVYPEFNNERKILLDTKILETCLKESSVGNNKIELFEAHQKFENNLNNLNLVKNKIIDFDLEQGILREIFINKFISYDKKYDKEIIKKKKFYTAREKLIKRNISIFGKERIQELLKKKR